MRRGFYITIFLLTITQMVEGQVATPTHKFWNSKSLSGLISLRGQYRQEHTIINSLEDNQISSWFTGGFRLNSDNYIYDPGIFTLNLTGEFNPESRDERYLSVPDRAEVRTIGKVDIMSSLLSSKPVNLNAYYGHDLSYYNRELLTNVRSNSNRWGGTLSVSNPIAPISITYRNYKWDQEEIQASREYHMSQDNIQVSVGRSFFNNDNHEFVYAYDNYKYKYSDANEVTNRVNRATLQNSFFFDSDKRYGYNSYASWYDQEGTYSFTKIDLSERINFRFTKFLRFNGSYNFSRISDLLQTINQHRTMSRIQHQLYESLFTNIFIDFTSSDQTFYQETNLRFGGEIRYTKTIGPARLNLQYKYFRHNNKMSSEPIPIQINNEEHDLIDGEIVLLSKPFTETSSILVKDFTGTIFYQENFDYVIVPRNDFVEIERVPGGQISNGQTITVDYIATQPGSYSFGANNHTIMAGLSFFNNLVEVYYRGSFQKYPKLIDAEYLTIDIYDQTVYGARFDLRFATTGIEYDRYNSTILPYESISGYLNMRWSIKDKLLLSTNGSLRRYSQIADETNQLYANLSGRITFNFSPRTSASLEMGYLKQTNLNFDLNLVTGRVEINTSLKKLFLKGGLELFRRQYTNSDILFSGTFIEVSRKF